MVVDFTLVQGHRVASGLANDKRFPKGTIAAQQPYFKSLGLDLSPFHFATLNAKFNCDYVQLNTYHYYFKQVKWHQQMPAEDFKFCHCHVVVGEQSVPGLIYQPMPSTKTAHFQPKNQLELLAPFIANLQYGTVMQLEVADFAITLR
ncbi:hypothetical protein SAMN05216262_106124 [Colwellia chukchiensis]|uniref:Uncharacterized protein n=1 Tax=Colwellia chukchiensis TaxID=641665 RepID=A0A1H7MUR2_9GAMM|nr:hypothetical protein [Colwellia chukchiensis]SEL14415.1 hypothetical protein SAMN05216262_106124 [Colwellia chukchiensis]